MVNKTVSIEFSPLKLIIGIIIIILIIFQIFQSISTSSLRKENKILKKENRVLLNNIKIRNIEIKKDSIVISDIDKLIFKKDSLIFNLKNDRKYFKDRAYINYLKYKNEKIINYNNSSDSTKTIIFSRLARENN